MAQTTHPARYLLGLITVITASIVVTLLSIDVAIEPIDTDSEVLSKASPLGYTTSLVLFVIPILVLAWWFFHHPEAWIQKRAFWRTIALITPLGFGLDFLLADRLFEFNNPSAVIGISVPVLGGEVPIEEFIFYLTGFVVVLLTYIWADEFWLAEYNIPDYRPRAQEFSRLVLVHPASLWIGGLLIAVGIGLRTILQPSLPWLPLYFTFLVLAAILPSAALFRATRDFINWRAFSFTFFLILLVSVIWEVTLAQPYRWWEYQNDQMLGIFIKAWYGLPIEAVLVWVAVTFTTVITYEVVKIWQASGRAARSAFFG